MAIRLAFAKTGAQANRRGMMRDGFIRAAVVGTVLVASAGAAFAQSAPPWCDNGGRKNPAERTICVTESLWYLDDTLNLSYAFAHDRLSAAQKKVLEASQANWLRATRDACGADAECLARVMQSRMDALDDINNRGRL
jgi:uncharacterized protein